jgi:hypothetical protein
MQYDFNLTPGGGMKIDVKGRFFKYRSGTGPIRVRASRGGYVDLMPGQGVNNHDFDSLIISDLSMAINAGIIIAGDFDFRDDRITGTVDVLDGGWDRVVSGRAFSGAVAITPSENHYSTISLFNPESSQSRVMLQQMIVSSNLGGRNRHFYE